MKLNGKDNILEQQQLRDKKNALKYLKEIFKQNKEKRPRRKGEKKDLQQIVRKMRIERLKEIFESKLQNGNIYREAITFELLSQKEKDKKRLIKLKGLKIHQYILSFIYILQLLFLVITFFISSFIAFLPNFIQVNAHNSIPVVLLNLITIFFSTFKIFVTSTAQKIKKGVLLEYFTDIFFNYFKSFIIIIDLIYLTIIIALLFSRDHDKELATTLFVWSIVRISVSNQNLTLIRTTFIDSFKKDQYYKLFNVIIFNFIFAHFVTSILLAMSQIDNNKNWMIQMNINNQIWYVQYMWSYYWATTIMMTVGFGDFLPVTFREAFIVSFLQFFSCIVLAYNISQIGSIISSIRSSQSEYIQKIAIFKRMAKQNEIDLTLKIRIESYLREQRQVKQKYQFNQQKELLDSLPEPLRNQFITVSNGKVFSYLPFFKNLQRKTLMRFSQSFKSKVYYPGQFILKANQLNYYIKILKDGKVGMTYKKQESLLNGIVVQQIQIQESQYISRQGHFIIGSLPFLLTTQFLNICKLISYDEIALTYSLLFQISHQDFLNVIKDSHIDKQYYFSMIHMHIINPEQWEQLPCQYCSMKHEIQVKYKKQQQRISQRQKELRKSVNGFQKVVYHSKFDCPRLHYCPQKRIVVYKQVKNQGQEQIRQTKYRRKKYRANCLLLRKKGYKQYERKRFINQKKQFERYVQKSLWSRSKFGRNQESRVRFQQQRLRRINSLQFNVEPQFNQNEVQNKEIDFINDQTFDQDLHEENKTIIQTVVKYAMQQVNSKHQPDIWSLQIDKMMNYFNYFPNENASKFDNLQICKNKLHKNKALCMIGQFLKRSKFTQIQTNNYQARPYSNREPYQRSQIDQSSFFRNPSKRKYSNQTDIVNQEQIPSNFKEKKVKISEWIDNVIQSKYYQKEGKRNIESDESELIIVKQKGKMKQEKRRKQEKQKKWWSKQEEIKIKAKLKRYEDEESQQQKQQREQQLEMQQQEQERRRRKKSQSQQKIRRGLQIISRREKNIKDVNYKSGAKQIMGKEKNIKNLLLNDSISRQLNDSACDLTLKHSFR